MPLEAPTTTATLFWRAPTSTNSLSSHDSVHENHSYNHKELKC
jgi:hypothetical protein